MTLKDYSAQLMVEDLEPDQQQEPKGVRYVSVFRVTQGGRTDHLLTEGGGAMDTLHAALRLRAYLSDKDGSSERFVQTIPAADVITTEAFREYADEMRQGVGEVTAALDIDLDRGTFSTMAGADGWQTYTVSDVLTAAWNATIPHWSDWEARRCVFAEQLEGKLIDQEHTGITPPTGPAM